jgi:hypothetical protein
MNPGRVFFGSLVLALGGLLLLDVFGVLSAGEVIAAWWPLALVAAGVVSFAVNPRHWLAPLILTVGGGSLLLATTGVVDTWAVVGPVLLVVFGFALIVGRGFGRRSAETGDEISSFSMFAGEELASHSHQFKGGNVGVLFGGAELDLTDAELAPGAALDVFAAFGGVEIKVPDGWDVRTKGFPLLGGIENVTVKDKVPVGAPTLDVNATALFGGLEIKH